MAKKKIYDEDVTLRLDVFLPKGRVFSDSFKSRNDVEIYARNKNIKNPLYNYDNKDKRWFIEYDEREQKWQK